MHVRVYVHALFELNKAVMYIHKTRVDFFTICLMCVCLVFATLCSTSVGRIGEFDANTSLYFSRCSDIRTIFKPACLLAALLCCLINFPFHITLDLNLFHHET